MQKELFPVSLAWRLSGCVLNLSLGGGKKDFASTTTNSNTTSHAGNTTNNNLHPAAGQQVGACGWLAIVRFEEGV